MTGHGVGHHGLRFFLAVAIGAIAYRLAGELTLPWSGWLLPSRAPSSMPVLYGSLHLMHMVVLVAISLPLAILLHVRHMGVRRPVLAAFLIAFIGLAAPAGFELLHPRYIGTVVNVSNAIDLVKFLLILPTLTWLAGWLLPFHDHNRSKPMPRGESA